MLAKMLVLLRVPRVHHIIMSFSSYANCPVSLANTSTYFAQTPPNFNKTRKNWRYPVWDKNTESIMDAEHLEKVDDDDITPLLHMFCPPQTYIDTAKFLIQKGWNFDRISQEVNKDLLEKGVPLQKRESYMRQLVPLQAQIARNKRKRFGSDDHDDVDGLINNMGTLSRMTDSTGMGSSPPRARPFSSDDRMNDLIAYMNGADMNRNLFRRRTDFQ